MMLRWSALSQILPAKRDTQVNTPIRKFKLSASNWVLLLLCLMFLILYVDRVNISTAAPLNRADLKLSNTELGLVFSAFAYPFTFLQLVGGWLGDKFGARATLGISGIIVVVATAATGGLASLFAARLALGIGEGATFPTATRAMATWTPEANWGFAHITHAFAGVGVVLPRSRRTPVAHTGGTRP